MICNIHLRILFHVIVGINRQIGGRSSMREIKCKAFRKDSGEVGEVLSIDLESGRAKIEFYTKENEYYHLICELNDENIVIRWYTGLKDKNRTEIYEGDIIECKKINEVDSNYRGYVLFDKSSWRVNWDDDLWIRKDLEFWAKERYIKVIGNIYKNPVLLE